MKAVMTLEDGTMYEGRSYGAEGEVAGEVMFNTQVIGYQEILTDPANRGRIVVMGYPHIGNYGINARCYESDNAQASAMVVKEFSKIYSNWQAQGSLGDFMKKNNIIGIEGIDTRSLTVHLRDNGEMRGIISTKDFKKASLVKKAKEYKSPKLAEGTAASSAKKGKDGESKSQTVIINIGLNNSTLARYPGAVIMPGDSAAEKILAGQPQLVVISGGPGDPRSLEKLSKEIKKLIGQVDICGIQNGACLLALALGGTVYRMKVGHHGMNIPVVKPASGEGEITTQNHSYGVDKLPRDVKTVYVNLNDKTIEAFATKDGRCRGTLYYPLDERGKLAPDYKFV